MLPVVAGVEATSRSIVRYSVVLVVCSLVLWPVAHTGPIYVIAATVLGVVFLARAMHLRARQSSRAAMSLFRYSIIYLALLFGAVALDTIVRHGL
jgi:protoheme IX farnesyltransferase